MNPPTVRIGVLRWPSNRRAKQRQDAEHHRALIAFAESCRRDEQWYEATSVVTKIGFWARVHRWLT